MATRETDERLQRIWDSGGKTYSISKLNNINQCQWQAYLTYVVKQKQKDSIYGILGTKTHDKIEEFVHGTATNEDIKNAITEELKDMVMLGIEFPLDRNGNSTIRDNWIANMTRLSDEFYYPEEREGYHNEILTEQLIIYDLGDNKWMMGYADAIRKNEDGTVTLIDWKTSANFDMKV